MKILIADDEKEFVDFLAERLSGQGHNISLASDGAIALELIKANEYDIVFLDHNMPELTGLEIAKYAKANGIKAKIVMVTGYEHMSGAFAKVLGVDEYLTKPVMIKDIDEVVKKYDITGK
ncbi:MAG: response regulator [Candidatus Omnitrophota bacterium]